MLTIRQFQPSDTEYEEIVRVFNLEWPKEPQTVRNFKWGDDNWNQEYLFQRFVAEMDGKMLVEGAYFVPYWSLKPGKFKIGWSLDPDYSDYQEDGIGIHEHLLNYCLTELADHNPKLLDTGTRENKTKWVMFLQENGFELKLREPISELEVDTFDFAPYSKLPAKVAQKGIEIHTLDQLMQNDPNWLNKVYELCWELEQDVPQTDPPTKEPLPEWKKMLTAPEFLAEGWFIALDTNIDDSNYTDDDKRGNYVGISMLGTDTARPEMMHTWLTGVVRSHRRKGVATVMKVEAIEFAKNHGAKRIDTGNEENNPMYDLNMQLGFKPKPAWVNYQKTL